MSVLATLKSVAAAWGLGASDVARQYQRACKENPAILPDLAAYAGMGEPMPMEAGAAQRQAGRQDVILYVCDMLRVDPLELDRIVRGETSYGRADDDD